MSAFPNGTHTKSQCPETPLAGILGAAQVGTKSNFNQEKRAACAFKTKVCWRSMRVKDSPGINRPGPTPAPFAHGSAIFAAGAIHSGR
eukprot:scaffold26827_cov24-Prasinocladus_malaysianus.AAC.1